MEATGESPRFGLCSPCQKLGKTLKFGLFHRRERILRDKREKTNRRGEGDKEPCEEKDMTPRSKQTGENRHHGKQMNF